MAMFTSIALLLFYTLESMATPCSVNTNGMYFAYSPFFKVPIWHLRESYSSEVSSNMKSFGKRSMFLPTCNIHSSGDSYLRVLAQGIGRVEGVAGRNAHATLGAVADGVEGVSELLVRHFHIIGVIFFYRRCCKCRRWLSVVLYRLSVAFENDS
jgi:hypothetical protein